MNKEVTYSLFQQNPAKLSEESESIKSIKRLESSVFNHFSARRNAARIDHYFVNVHSFRFKIIVYFISVILTIFTVVATSVLTNQHNIRFINTNSISMMDTIHNKITTTTNSALFEPQFFSSVFSDLLEKPEFVIPARENAQNITQMFYKASLAGSGYIVLWELGLPWGEEISLETNSKQTYLIHSNTTSDNLGALQYWPTDRQCKNSSFPDEGGILIKSGYNSTNTKWYEAAVKSKSTTWTDIYEGLGSHGQKLLVSSVKPIISESTGAVTTVVSNSIDLKGIQEFIISQQPSNNSRLALTTSSGTVLAMTGDDKFTTDEFTDTIVTKQLEELEDYIWRCVTFHSGYLDDEDNQLQCKIDGKVKEFHLSKEIIRPAPGVEWVLWSVLSIDDFVGDVSIRFRNILIVTLVVIICLWIFINLTSVLLVAYIESMQNRILNNHDNFLNSKESKKHVEDIGVIYAIKELKSLLRNNTDNQVIVEEINNVIDQLQSLNQELLYNREDVYSNIKNPEVKNAMVGLYGVPLISLKSNRIIRGNSSKSSISSSVRFNFSQNEIELENINSPNFGNRNDGYRCQLDPSKRICQLQISPQMMKNRVLMIFIQANSRSKMFMNEDFQLIIEASLKEIGDPIDKFAADSIDFLHTLCRKFDYILNNPDFELSLLVASLVWHLFMKDRNKPGVDRIHRYFTTNEDENDLKIAAREFLLNLFNKRVLNDDYNQRWDLFCSAVLSMIQTSSISLQCSVISQFKLISKWIAEKGTLFSQQKIVFIRLLFNFSMVSFFFHPEQFIVAYSRILNPDYDDEIDEIAQFSHCIFYELIDPTVSALRCVCEPQFFISMRCE